MRIYLSLTPNTSPVPYDYLPTLTACVHRWLGPDNTEHDDLSLYSFSRLQGSKAQGKKGLNFAGGAEWFISAHSRELIGRLVQGITVGSPEVGYGMQVSNITLQEDPVYDRGEQLFVTASPVFVKRKDKSGTKERNHYYFYNDPEADALITETLITKLQKAGLADTGVEVKFDKSYPRACRKLVTYKDIGIKGSVCPVIVKGTPEQIAFARNVGIGNSTGIGFGALK